MEPPDPAVAAGPSDVVEAVNGVMRVTDKSGNQLSVTPLNGFFGAPNSQYVYTSPRVEWDSSISRWFLSGFGLDSAHDSDVLVAASMTADPTGNWFVYDLVHESGVITSQPRLGSSGNFVVLSWDDYNGGNGGFIGNETWLLEKVELPGGGPVHTQSFGPDPREFSVIPAQDYDNDTSTAYAVENASCGSGSAGTCTSGTSSFQLITFTGFPNVTRNIDPMAFGPTQIPPNADQPGPNGVASINTNDDRFLSDIKIGGMLYVAGQ